MANVRRQLIVLTSLGTLSLAQVPGVPPPGQLTSLRPPVTAGLPIISDIPIVSSLPDTTSDASTLLTTPTPTTLTTSLTSAQVQSTLSITNLETFPSIIPDSTTQSNVQSVTDLESFPFITPDVTSDISSVTNLETLPSFILDSASSSELALQTITDWFPSTSAASISAGLGSSTLLETSNEVTPVETVTNLETFPSILDDLGTSVPAVTVFQSTETSAAASSVNASSRAPVAAPVIVTAPSSLAWFPDSPRPSSSAAASVLSVIPVSDLISVEAVSATSAAPAMTTTYYTSAPSCNIYAPQCPLCDQAQVADRNGTSYRIYCDALVLSSKNYLQVGASSAASCLEACDDFPGCGAASLSQSGNCLLGVGSYYYLSMRQNEFGYLRLRPASNTTSSSVSASTTKALPTNPPNQPGCTLTDFNCPRCNLINIADSQDQEYRILCDAYLKSANSSDIQDATLDECLSRCDNDLCVGASYFQGQCHLAYQRLIGSTATEGSFAFIPLRQNSIDTGTTTEQVASGGFWLTTTSTSSASLASINPMLLTPSAFPTEAFTPEEYSSRTTLLQSSVATASATPATSRRSSSTLRGSSRTAQSTAPATPTVSCPAANEKQYALGTINRPFTIFCDVAVYDQPYSIYPVTSLVECARGCDSDCAAFEYVNDICQLFDTSAGVVSAQGAMVGYAFDFDVGVSGPSVFDVPGPVSASLPAVSPAVTQAVATSIDT